MRSLISAAVNVVPWGLRKHIKHIPGVARLQRLLVSRAFDGREFVHEVKAGPARGVKFRICMPEDKGIWTGTYEAAFSMKVAESVRSGIVAYDVGGWHGFFTAIMASRGARSVHVFEPLPDNINRIEQLMQLNPELPVRLHRCALGAEPGVSELIVMPESSMAKLVDSPFQKEKGGLLHEVKVDTIDAIVARGAAPPPDLIKMDIEGYELLALSGARKVLEAYGPIFLAEIHSPRLLRDCSTLLAGLGYTTEVIDTCALGDETVYHVRSARM